MRRWIQAHGSPLGAAAWGKFTLCLLGLYDWRGIHPVLPELWLLPTERADAPEPLLVPLPPGLLAHGVALRPPGDGAGGAAGSRAARRALRGRVGSASTGSATAIPSPPARPIARRRSPLRADEPGAGRDRAGGPAARASARARRGLPARRLRGRVTDFIDIGPVNKVLNTFVHHFEDPGGESSRRAFAACDLYLWKGHDGTKMQGYNSSKLWDTAFAAAGRARGGPGEHGREARRARCSRGLRLRARQPDPRTTCPTPLATTGTPRAAAGRSRTGRTDGRSPTAPPKGSSARSRSKGATRPGIPEGLLRDAVRLMLSWQNDDGGWATYERKRGGRRGSSS